MPRPTRSLLAAVLALGVAVLPACSGQSGSRSGGRGAGTSAPAPNAPGPSPAPAPSSDPAALPPGTDAVVVSITDGDTIVVRTATGATERVRLIGIDTPETRDPRRPVECFGREASARTAALVPPGTPVRLELDVEARDRYDRLLAYVWRMDGVHVNVALVEDGWAVPYRYPPNVRYADELSRLGATARAEGRGLWSACGGPDTPAG